MKYKYILPLVLSASALMAQSPAPSDSPSPSPVPSITPAPLAELPVDGFITLEQIRSDFASQPEAAKQKYGGHPLLVYGRLVHLLKANDMEGAPIVGYLQNAEHPAPDVECIFAVRNIPPEKGSVELSQDQQEVFIYRRDGKGSLTHQLPILQVGDTVGVRGTFSDANDADIILKDCRRVPETKLAEVLAAHGMSVK